MKQEMKDIRIPVTIGGVTFKNPFYVASGPTTKTVKQLKRIEETGWAAASIKLSIDPAPYINRKPRYGIFEDRNALAFTTEKRLTFAEGLKLVEDAKKVLTDLKLMANITYAGDEGPAGWVNMAKKFEEVGADIIELNMCCPNMSYNLELTSGGAQTASKQTGASMGQNANVAAEIVKAVKEAISIPLFVKLTPEGGKIAQVAKSLYEAGADAVGGTGNRMGLPPINLEHPEKAFYHLQDEISMSCHCGTWLKPLAQRDTYEIRKVCGKEPPIMAAGGITNWKDAVEMVMCGGNLIGVCAETLISGYDIVRPMIKGMSDYMEEHGYATLDDFRSMLVDELKTATDVTLYAGYAHIKEPNLSAPCKSSCPHHVPVQAYVQKIAKGEYREAYDLITGKNALQNLCALVCTHPCEDACIRGGFDSPVKIRELKRFVLEYGKAQGWKPVWAQAKPNGIKVAVIGAGACGLSCAAELIKGGYDVTVFEKEDTAGGKLRYGAPDYVYQKQILNEEVANLESFGVKFEFGKCIEDVNVLKEAGFAKVFAAVGACEKKDSGLGGEDALEFLYRVNTEKVPGMVKERVAVIGSGFAAVDAARCAVRLGAKQVTLLSPAAFSKRSGDKEALDLAKEEGVVLLDNASQVQMVKDGVSFVKEGAAMTLGCDQVLVENEYVTKLPVSDGDFLMMSSARITNVISAITAGKNAALAIDQALRQDEATLQPIPATKTVNPEIVRRRTGYLKRDVNPVKLAEKAEERVQNFNPYKRVMTEEEAVKEASRCLNCGCGEGCQLCKTICTDFAPEVADADTMHIRKEECVACGMCFNRCPNGNIEMINLGVTV
ncbi:MAG: FAD-dependent oxidoreductase [Lachnospiraceae bacterium]|nr:FAD-dependent oxidoreductase [Lachnospiraceae bacterium]